MEVYIFYENILVHHSKLLCNNDYINISIKKDEE